jgi:hypothetical protein
MPPSLSVLTLFTTTRQAMNSNLPAPAVSRKAKVRKQPIPAPRIALALTLDHFDAVFLAKALRPLRRRSSRAADLLARLERRRAA